MKIAVGISGGVDSAVAALILKEAGAELVGVTMTLSRADEEIQLAAARQVAAQLEIPLKVIDLHEAWRREVLGYLGSTYLKGETPNPCVRCNETVKFSLLPRWAFETLGAECFATGHYARLQGERLYRGIDRPKDQSYFLYRIKPEIRRRTLFPLGGMTKLSIRERARNAGILAAERSDSQDFCGGDPKTIIREADRDGEVVTLSGKVIGHHHGFWHYTVGQRRGLGIGGGTPYYIVGLDAARNQVIVGGKADAVKTELQLRDTVGRVDFSLPVKVRSAGEPKLLKAGIAGIAPGQSAVFYDGDEVVGGGVIV